jgi:hemerythrin
MSLLQWSDKFKVGNEDIDYQHERLFTLVNNLHDSMKAGDDMRILVDVFLNQLIQYTDFHFSNEERFMKESGYPKFQEHKAAHDALRAQVADFQKKFTRGEADVTEDLMKFLRDWLVGHIGETDTKLAAHLKH